MTGRLARLMVGTCMAAALTVSGLVSSMPAAHAVNKCVDKPLISIVECNDINILGNGVNVTVGNVDVSLVEVENVLNGNWVSIPIANGNSLEIETAIKNVLNHNNIHVCVITVTVNIIDKTVGTC